MKRLFKAIGRILLFLYSEYQAGSAHAIRAEENKIRFLTRYFPPRHPEERYNAAAAKRFLQSLKKGNKPCRSPANTSTQSPTSSRTST